MEVFGVGGVWSLKMEERWSEEKGRWEKMMGESARREGWIGFGVESKNWSCYVWVVGKLGSYWLEVSGYELNKSLLSLVVEMAPTLGDEVAKFLATKLRVLV